MSRWSCPEVSNGVLKMGVEDVGDGAIILTLFEVETILIERVLFGFHYTDEEENYAVLINQTSSRKMGNFKTSGSDFVC